MATKGAKATKGKDGVENRLFIFPSSNSSLKKQNRFLKGLENCNRRCQQQNSTIAGTDPFPFTGELKNGIVKT